MPAVGRRRRVGGSSAIGHLLVVRRPRGSGGSSICEGLRILGLPTPEQSRAGASLPAPAPFTSRPPPGRLFCDRYDLFAPLASPVSVAPMWLPSPKLPSPQHHPALQHFREGATYLVGSCTKYRSAMGRFPNRPRGKRSPRRPPIPVRGRTRASRCCSRGSAARRRALP